MILFDRTQRDNLEKAARVAGFELEPSEYDSFALIKNANRQNLTTLLSGEPILFGRFALRDNPGFQVVSFIERDKQDFAQVKDIQGSLIAEHPAQIMVPRHSESPSPMIVFGGPGCFLEIMLSVNDCLQAHLNCRGFDLVWSSCR